MSPFFRQITETKLFRPILLVLILILIVGAALFYFTYHQKAKNDDVVVTTEDATSTAAGTDEHPVNPALHYISNISDYSYLTTEQQNLLVKNQFVVDSSGEREFFSRYESNRYAFIPSFVTTDSLLHTYHIMFDHLLKQLEEKKLAGELQKLNVRMVKEATQQLAQLKGTEWENAAKRNLAFFVVGSRLLDPKTVIPAVVKNQVNAELSLIAKHDGVKESPVMNMGTAPGRVIDTPQGSLSVEQLKEDYSQYIPRGHYDKTEQLKAYFKSMMWYGRLTFRFKNDDEIRSALLITIALQQGDNQKLWNNVFEPINFFVGKTDDIVYSDTAHIAVQVYGAYPTIPTLLGNTGGFDAFKTEAKKLSPPQINSVPVFNANIQPDRETEIKGFRFFGQRFTIDASIFQRLIDREVRGRMLPKGLDIPAALGSKEALRILTDSGEVNAYPTYIESMGKVKTYVASLPETTWTQNLYWGWLNALRPLLAEKSDKFPPFMRSVAWARKELNTFMGSWTELKHDTILYAKQSYAELGGGGPDERDDRGYVEPNVEVYARLASLLNATISGLEQRGLLDDAMKENLNIMHDLAFKLQTISEHELNGTKITDDEYEFIRSYGGQLEHLWLEVNKEDMKTTDLRTYLDENPAALVADVATDPNGRVLEEATGYVSRILVVVPVEGKSRIAEGWIYSYYEFPWPLNDRLTDKKWRTMLREGTSLPKLPDWTNIFTAQQ